MITVITALSAAPAAAAPCIGTGAAECPYQGVDVLDARPEASPYYPAGVAVNPVTHEIYVADRYANVIKQYTQDGTLLRSWGGRDTFGLDDLDQPVSVTIDAGGDVWATALNSNRVSRFDADGDLVSVLGTGQGPSFGQFVFPDDVAIAPDGHVWVADTYNNRVQEFAADGTFLAAYGATGILGQPSAGTGPGEFNRPTGITVAPNGDVYVADSNNNRLQRLPSGTTIWEPIGAVGGGSGPGDFFSPQDVIAEPDGSLYVAQSSRTQKRSPVGVWSELAASEGGDEVDVDAGKVFLAQGAKRRVRVLDATTGAPVALTNPIEPAVAEIRDARGTAVDGAGNVFVADSSANRIVKLNASGVFIAAFGTAGNDPGELNGPGGVAVDAAGDVYVADTSNNRIQQLDGDTGAFVAAWGSAGTSAGQFGFPQGVAVAGDGSLIVADAQHSRIQRSNPARTSWTVIGGTPDQQTGTAVGEFHFAADVAVNAAGDVWAADPGNHRVQKLPNGSGTWQAFGSQGSGATNFNAPRGIDVSADGTRVVVTDANNNRVQQLTGTGTFDTRWGASGPDAPCPGHLSQPWGIALKADGTVLVSENITGQVSRFEFGSGTVPACDRTAPSVGVLSPANSATGVAASPTFTASGGIGAGDSPTLKVRVLRSTGAATVVVRTLSSTDRTGTTWTVPFSGSPLADGQYQWEALQGDAAGNERVSDRRSFTVGAPVATSLTITQLNTGLPVSGSSPGANPVTHDQTPTFSGTALSGGGDPNTVTVHLDRYNGSTFVPDVHTFETTRTGSTWSVTSPVVLVPETWQVRVTQGGQSSSPWWFQLQAVTISQLATGTPVSGAAPGANPVLSDTTPTFAGTSLSAPGDPDTVTVHLDRVDGPEEVEDVHVFSTTRGPNGGWEATAPELVPGSYRVRATQGDSTSAGWTFRIPGAVAPVVKPPAATGPEAVLVPGSDGPCPVLYDLSLRSEIDVDALDAGRLGLTVEVPAAGITVTAAVADADVLAAGGGVASRTSTKPSTLRIPLKASTTLGRRGATRVTLITAVKAAGCPTLYAADDFEVEKTPDGKLETTATGSTASTRTRMRARAAAVKLVRLPPNADLARAGVTEIDCGPNSERQPPSDDPRYPASRHLIQAGSGNIPLNLLWICATYGAPPKCEERLDIPGVSSAVLKAECLTRSGEEYTSTGWVQLNGIRFTPGGGKITVDPARASMTFSGAVKVTTPVFRDGRATGETIVLHDGAIKDPVLIGREMSVLGGGKSVGGKLVGFKLVSDITMKLGTVPGGAQLGLRVELPDTWGGVQGRVTIDANPQGADVRSANVFVPKIEYKGFTLSDLRLRYLLRPKDNKQVFIFEKAILEIPVAKEAKKLGGFKVEIDEVVFADGKLEKFEIKAGIDFKLKILKLARLVDIPELRAAMDLQRKPGFLEGSARVTIGPSIGPLDLIALKGRIGFDFTAVPEFFIRNATLVTLGNEQAGGDFSFRPDGWTTFGGAAQINAGFNQFVGRIRGQFIPDVGFEAYGRGVWNMFGYQLTRSDMKFKAKYAAACGRLELAKMTVGIYLSYEQPLKVTPMQGCGFGEWGETGGRPGETNPGQSGRRAVAATAVRTFTVPAGLPKAAFSVVGRTAAPKVTLVAPDGSRITAPTVRDGVFAQAIGAETVFAVNKPAAGTWTIDAADGSPAISEVRFARGLDPPKIKAKVTRPTVFLDRQLDVTVDGPKGTEVTFWEEPVDNDIDVTPEMIGKAGPGTTRLKFEPAPGRGGLREVVASVEQDGIALGESTVVARYRFTDPAKPSGPCISPSGDCTLKLARKGDTLDIGWKQSKNAIAHRVTVRVDDGRNNVFFVGPRTTRLKYKDVDPDDGARVRVVGVNELDQDGPAATGTLKGGKPRPRKPLKRTPAPDDVGTGVVYLG